MHQSKFKNLVLFSLIMFFSISLSGCSRDYSAIVNDYNKTITKAGEELIDYYKSMSDLKTEMYFQSRRAPVPYSFRPKAEEKTKLADDHVYKQYRIDFKELNNPKSSIFDPFNETSEKILIKSVNGLVLYSKYLLDLYNDPLPEIAESGINSMVQSVKDVSSSVDFLDSDKVAIATGAGTVAAKLVNLALQVHRDNNIRRFVNKANPIIQEYLCRLDRASVLGLQAVAESVRARYLKDEILFYNTQVEYMKSNLLKPNSNDFNSNELLRLDRLTNIQKEYTAYVNLQKANPKPLIDAMKNAQCELVAYVNGRTKDPKQLLYNLNKIKSIVETINSVIP